MRVLRGILFWRPPPQVCGNSGLAMKNLYNLRPDPGTHMPPKVLVRDTVVVPLNLNMVGKGAVFNDKTFCS